MTHPQVTVTLKGDRAEFQSNNRESDGFRDYLCKLFEQVNNPGPAQATLLAKAKLGGVVLDLRKAQEDKIHVLKDVIEAQDERSRDWSLAPEVRSIAAERSRAAKEEIRRLTAELGE